MKQSDRIPVTHPALVDRNGDRRVLGYASTEIGAIRVISKTGRTAAHMLKRQFRGRLVWEPA